MKRVLAILLLAAMVLCAGCRKVPQTYTYKVNGKTLTVNTVDKTIDDGKYIYRYAVDKKHNITITYPDGSVYPSDSDLGVVVIGGADGNVSTDSMYRPGSAYVSGWVLMNSLEKVVGKQATFHLGYFLLGLLVIAMGLLGALDPETAILWRHLWWFKDAEPTDYAIFMTRLGGIVSVVIGIVFVILSFTKL